MGTVVTRPREPRDDARVRELVGDVAGVDVIVSEEVGEVSGAAVFCGARLGAVVPADENRRDVFYRLVRGVATAMLERGLTRGSFEVYDLALLGRIERDFRVEPQVIGRDPSSDGAGTPLAWRIEVDLADAVAQLDRALAKIER